MDEEKQFMKYLSWLDDLDQDFIFDDAGNALAVRMSRKIFFYLFIILKSIYFVK